MWAIGEPASGWALFWSDLLSPLHFREGWHILFPLATLGKDGVGFNDSNLGHR